jgi:hypothetical protein
MSSIVIAGDMYTVSQAIWWFNNIRKDKTTMMSRSSSPRSCTCSFTTLEAASTRRSPRPRPG